MEKLPNEILKHLLNQEDLKPCYHYLIIVSQTWKTLIIDLIKQSTLKTPTEYIHKQYICHLNYFYKNKIEFKYCKHLLNIVRRRANINQEIFEWACGFDYAPCVLHLMNTSKDISLFPAILITFEKNCYNVASMFATSTEIPDANIFDAVGSICKGKNPKMIPLCKQIFKIGQDALIQICVQCAIRNKSIDILSYALENFNVLYYPPAYDFFLFLACGNEFIEGLQLLMTKYNRQNIAMLVRECIGSYLKKSFEYLINLEDQFLLSPDDIIAAIIRYPEFVLKLLPRVTNNDYQAYLENSIKYNRYDLVKYFANHNPKISLIWFISHGYLDDVLDNISKIDNPDYASYLSLSIEKNHPDLVRYFIEFISKEHQIEKALIYFIDHNFLEDVKKLIVCLFKPNYASYSEHSIRNNHYNLVQYFAKYNLYNSLLWFIKHGYIDDVKPIIGSGINIHCDNERALRYAARNGCFEVVQLLLSRGCDPMVMNYYPVKRAIKNGHLNVVSALASHIGIVKGKIINVDLSMKSKRLKWSQA